MIRTSPLRVSNVSATKNLALNPFVGRSSPLHKLAVFETFTAATEVWLLPKADERRVQVRGGEDCSYGHRASVNDR